MSRAELVQICIELDINHIGLSISEMKERIKKIADKKFNKKRKIGNSLLSETLVKFLTEEYDYVLKDRQGKRYNYKGKRL